MTLPPTVPVPKLVTVDVGTDEFVRECRKSLPAKLPSYTIGDVIELTREFGRIVPGLIAGVSSRVGGWKYEVICPRYDGVLERVDCADEGKIKFLGRSA